MSSLLSSSSPRICWSTFSQDPTSDPSSSSSKTLRHRHTQEEEADLSSIDLQDVGHHAAMSIQSKSTSFTQQNLPPAMRLLATTTMGKNEEGTKSHKYQVGSNAGVPVIENCIKCTNSRGKLPVNFQGDEVLSKRVFSFQDAPSYLRFNPFITGGYRSSIAPTECLQSIFWWTNETVNIWSHLIGWAFFFSLSLYDAFGLLYLPTSHPWDQTVNTLLLVCFQACMLLSSLYHIFCCHSEKYYRRWLSADLLGVSLSLLAIYISGIYYAFSCVPFWLNFYLVTVGAIFTSAMIMQILPVFSKKELVREEHFHLRLLIFGGWAAYGVVPTCHWAVLHGGMSSPVVALLLPRIVWMYLMSGAAFIFYIIRVPERLWPGLVNYVGSSHQLWHVLIVGALYHWHNTGMLYLEFRARNPCSDEYAFLFPETSAQLLE